jgi:uridine kinase
MILNEKIERTITSLIVEGTYILEIDDFDFKIFIDRNYKDTYENRMKRNRDEKSDFVEQVLEIEHQIIKQFKKKQIWFWERITSSC